MRVLRSIALPLVVAFVACGPPSSFDGLTGGLPEDAGTEVEASAPLDLVPDETLPAPRPIAPVSVSWVGTTRPKLRWELSQGTVGARVELCRTRACDGEKKTFEAAGPELVAPEDLAPGMWFWRLYGKTAATIGTKPSPTWQLLVRGGPVTEKTGGINGSLVDVNGDGRADLLVTLEYDDGAETFLDVVPLLATNDDSTAFATTGEQGAPIRALQLRGSETSLAGGIDTDGDGFTDVIVADEGTGPARDVLVVLGSPAGITSERMYVVPTPAIHELPGVHEAGDMDGDGWGDLIVTTSREVLGFFGTGRGFGPFQYLMQVVPGPDAGADGGAASSGATIAAGATVDRNGDGLSDVAIGSPIPESPLFFVLGGAEGAFGGFDPIIPAQPVRTAAERFASGDFDGDGLADTAFVTTQDGKPAVCVLRATEPEAAKVACFVPEAAPSGFAASITACDLEGDGRDEILVGSSSGAIHVLRSSDSELTATPITTEHGARITGIHPGRPGPAVWAATRSDGSSIAVFKGTTQVTTLSPVAQADRFGRWIR